MKITRLPKPTTSSQTIVIKESREGLFLRTLNLGCAIILLGVGAAIAIVVYKLNTAGESYKSPLPAVSQEAPKTPPTTNLYLFRERKDAMTDAMSYTFSWLTDDSKKMFSAKSDSLHLRFTPTEVSRSSHKIKYDIECFFASRLNIVERKKSTVLVRMDNRAPEAWTVSPSTALNGYFFEDSRGFLSAVAYARRVRIRFVDWGDEIHDLDFNLGFFSLQNFHALIVESVLRNNPPNVKIVD